MPQEGYLQMEASVNGAARDALQDLLDVSPQVEAAVLLTRGGNLLASSLEGKAKVGERLAELAVRVLAEAESARTELGREPVSQCELATGDGHVFVVGDAERVVLAVTAIEPTVGLVFYDIKTALRAVRDAAGTAGKPAGASSNGKATHKDTEGAKG